MRRFSRPLLCALPIVLLLAAAVPAQAAPQSPVRALVERLASDDYQEREAAHTALVHLGLPARDAVRAALAKASDPEVLARLEAVLQTYAVEEEERYAVERLARGDPFPAQPGDLKLGAGSGEPIHEALARIKEATGIAVEPWPGDADLAADLDRPVTGAVTSSGEGAVRGVLFHTLMGIDCTWVVDGARVVVVRLTPAVLFAKMARERRTADLSDLEETLRSFEAPSFDYFDSIWCHLRIKADEARATREKWFCLLRNRAMDGEESADHRALALEGLQEFLGSNDKPQPDVDDVFASLARDAKTPAEARRAAISGMFMGMTPAAKAGVLAILEGEDEEARRTLIEALNDQFYCALTCLVPMKADAPAWERFVAGLGKEVGSPDPQTSHRASFALANLEAEGAGAALVAREAPKEAPLLLEYLETVKRLRTPESRARVVESRSHPDPRVRAAVAYLLGNYAGGTGRGPDVELLLVDLEDEAPIVRFVAANGLGTVYSNSAAERFDEGIAEAASRLAALRARETDTRVRKKVEESLEAMKR